MKAFEKVIGYETVKRELIAISDALVNREAYGKLGVTAPRGLLLHGRPGVGKTLMANSLIEAAGRPAFICRKDRHDGEFIDKISKTFEEAKAAAPSVVFLDDMDKFANGDDRHPDAEEYVTVQSCIDDAEDSDVFVVATANSIRALPRSLLRAGRLDRVIEIETPSGEDAVKIIDHYIRSKKFTAEIDAEYVARLMPGNSCAQLETVINDAGLIAGLERADVITRDHFLRAALHGARDVPDEAFEGASGQVDLADPSDIMAHTVWHEAGHATVLEALCPGDVTIVAAFLRNGVPDGFTAHCRSGKCSLIGDLYSDACVSLGARASVEMKFGVTDTGSSEDLNRAYGTVWDVVTRLCDRGFDYHSNESFNFQDSPDLHARQEKAVSDEIERLYGKAREILSVNREFLEALAGELSRKCILDESEIAAIKERCRVVPVSL